MEKSPDSDPKNQEDKNQLGITGSYDNVDEFETKFNDFITGGLSKIYDRYSYPELITREDQIADSIGMQKGNVLLYNSGMAAINDSLLFSLKQGDVLFYDPSMYFQTPLLVNDYEKLGVKCVSLDMSNLVDMAEKISQYKPTVILAETVTNDGMKVLPLKEIIELLEKQNESQKGFKEIIEQKLSKSRSFLTSLPLDSTRIEALAESFYLVAKEIDTAGNYLSLRRLYKEIFGEGDNDKNNTGSRRSDLLELKMMIDSAWTNKREEKIKLILDNTLPGPKGNESLIRQINSHTTPITVIESGTKFFADDKVNLGLIYCNDEETMISLRIQRMRTGTILSPAAEARLPEISSSTLEDQKVSLRNTSSLAGTLSRAIGSSGIKFVRYPKGLSDKREDLSPILYIECDNPKELAGKIKDALNGEGMNCSYSVSFGFTDTRLFFVPGDKMLRIAGGKEDEETNLKICDVLLKKLTNENNE